MFVSFEGPEGSGKSTQIRLLAEHLRAEGHAVITTREPGGVGFSEALRTLVLTTETCDRAELLTFLAARAEHVEARIRPELQRGTWVLCDRFTDSTLAYQGYGLGLELELLRKFCAFAAGGLEPDLTVLLDLDPVAGLERKHQAQAAPSPRGTLGWPVEINRMELRDLEFHRRVREGFRKEAELAPRRIVPVDAADPVDVVQAQIRTLVAQRLKARDGSGGAQ